MEERTFLTRVSDLSPLSKLLKIKFSVQLSSYQLQKTHKAAPHLDLSHSSTSGMAIINKRPVKFLVY